VGKSILSILICALFFLILDEINASALPSRENGNVLIKKAGEEILSAKAGQLPSALTQHAIRITPASRCSHVLKDLGNGNWVGLSLHAASYANALQTGVAVSVDRRSYLSHIYPSHNFW
jgi:hypothetical protein